MLDSADDLAKYDAIVLIGSFQTGKGIELSADAKKNLLEFVKNGKGLYVQHYASASWQKWDEFTELCGRRWINGKSGHKPRKPFDVTIADTENPITKGLKGFNTDDELYAKLQGTAEVKWLVTAESDFSNKTEPLLFTHEYGKGRVILNQFGHDRKAMKPVEVQTMIVRGIEWAATGKVSEASK